MLLLLLALLIVTEPALVRILMLILMQIPMLMGYACYKEYHHDLLPSLSLEAPVDSSKEMPNKPLLLRLYRCYR